MLTPGAWVADAPELYAVWRRRGHDQPGRGASRRRAIYVQRRPQEAHRRPHHGARLHHTVRWARRQPIVLREAHDDNLSARRWHIAKLRSGSTSARVVARRASARYSIRPACRRPRLSLPSTRTASATPRNKSSTSSDIFLYSAGKARCQPSASSRADSFGGVATASSDFTLSCSVSLYNPFSGLHRARPFYTATW